MLTSGVNLVQGLPSKCSLVAISPQPLAEDGRVLLGARIAVVTPHQSMFAH